MTERVSTSFADKRVIWGEASPDQQTMEVGSEFLDHAPRNFLDFVVKESRRAPLVRLIEAMMVANDAMLAALEADSYRRDKHKGADLHKPNGGTVIICPGFGAKGDWYTTCKTFLENAGYKAKIFGASEYNLEPLERQIPRFVQTVKDEAQEAGEKVNLWLHSKAGIMGFGAHALYTEDMVENVNRVVAVGTGDPTWLNPLVLGGYYGNELILNGRDFEYARRSNLFSRSRAMEGLHVTTISKPDDPIMRSVPLGQHYFRIKGSHIGNGWALETLCLSVEAFRAENGFAPTANSYHGTGPSQAA